MYVHDDCHMTKKKISQVATEVLAEANVRCIDYLRDRISQLDFEPHVSGKVGWLVGWVDHVQHS